MANSANSLIGLSFLQRKGTVLDVRQEILNFPSFSVQLKDADIMYPNIIETLLNPHEIILQPGKQTKICVESQKQNEHEVAGVLQPSQRTENKYELIICSASKSSRNHQKRFISTTFKKTLIH